MNGYIYAKPKNKQLGHQVPMINIIVQTNETETNTPFLLDISKLIAKHYNLSIKDIVAQECSNDDNMHFALK